MSQQIIIKCIDKKYTLYYIIATMHFIWDESKNNKLRIERNISFEEMVVAIQNNGIIDIIDNPNSEKYENQKIYIISYNDYIYVMPVIQEKQHIKLLTIFKSRKFNKIYGRTGGKNETR